MNIAICIAGYLRKNDITSSNLFRKIIDFNRLNGHTVDVFVSTYSFSDSKNTFSHKQLGHTVNSTSVTEDSIKSSYSPKLFVIEDYDHIKHLFNIKNLLPDIDISSIHPDIHDGNGSLFGLSMHYKRESVNNLRKQYEKDNNVKYDLIMLCRADILFLENIDFSLFNPTLIYAREIYYDYFLISSPANMDIICSTYSNAKTIAQSHQNNQIQGFGLYSPEYFLEWCLLDNKITETNRSAISEFSCLLYPRKNFFSTLYFILNKFNKPHLYNNIILENGITSET